MISSIAHASFIIRDDKEWLKFCVFPLSRNPSNVVGTGPLVVLGDPVNSRGKAVKNAWGRPQAKRQASVYVILASPAK